MPRKKTEDSDQTDMVQESSVSKDGLDPETETEHEGNDPPGFDSDILNAEAMTISDNETNISPEGLTGGIEMPASNTDLIHASCIGETDLQDENSGNMGPEGALGMSNPETESENKLCGPDHDAFGEETMPFPDTGIETDSKEGVGSMKDILDKPETSINETDSEKPKRKRGRPRKKTAEEESLSAVRTKIKVPNKREQIRILAIGDSLSAELEIDKNQNDLFDLAESLNGYRILSGFIQGIEQTETGTYFAVIYYGGFKIIIPTEELIIMPKDIGDRDPLRVTHYLLNKRLGAEIDFVIKGLDQQAQIAVGSRSEAMARKRRRYFYDTDRDGNYRIYESLCAEARVVSVIRNGIFVEFFGVEVYIPLMELSYQRWHDAAEHYQTGEHVVVKVIALDKSDPDDIKVNLSVKQTGKNPFDDAFRRYNPGNRYIGVTSMIIPAGVIVALDGDIDCLCRFPERGRPPIGSRVAIKIHGVNVEQRRIWGSIVHVSPR